MSQGTPNDVFSQEPKATGTFDIYAVAEGDRDKSP
jgi:hypothetical protein